MTVTPRQTCWAITAALAMAATSLGGQPHSGELEIRLAALEPSQPALYLELGEELSYAGASPDDLFLARQLFVYAIELGRQNPSTRDTAASACLALAKLADTDRQARWLRSIATTLDARFVSPAWLENATGKRSDQAALDAATVLGLVRSGEGSRARDLMDQPEVRHLLERYRQLLPAAPGGDGLDQLEDQASQWPCPKCRNRQVVRTGSTQPGYVLCPTCAGDPGPTLTLDELTAHLRFESMLLSGIHSSWSAQVAADFGEPLRDPDPSEIAPVFGVDPAASVWRDGNWHSP